MTLKNLITKGLFPQEITPNFSSKIFGDIASLLLPNIDTYDPVDYFDAARNRNVKVYKKNSLCVDFSIPKIGLLRRRVGIPNPLHYLRLSDTIQKKWVDIITFTNQSQYSLSKLIVDTSSTGRSLIDPKFEDLVKERIIKSANAKYLLRIDISKFYGSIYTHSIPWAIHSKSISKQRRFRTSLLGNEIDQDSQKLQDGQTIGLPIGPDTSRIISEIIATAIDLKIKAKLPNLNVIRLVDDYFVYADSLAEIEEFNSLIQRELKEYELDLNASKQEVVTLPDVLENTWAYHLNKFRFEDSVKNQRRDLIQFFDESFRFSKEFPKEYVLRYATSRIRKIAINKNNIDLLVAFLLKCISTEPKTLPFVAETIIAYNSIKRSLLDLPLIELSLNKFLLHHIKLNNPFEVAWLTWFLKRMELPMKIECSSLIGTINNSTIGLEVLAMRDKGLIPNPVDTTLWQTNLNIYGLYSENWLLAYEAVKKGWLTTPTPYIVNDAFFNELQNRNVEFYDVAKDVSLSEVKAMGLVSIVLR